MDIPVCTVPRQGSPVDRRPRGKGPAASRSQRALVPRSPRDALRIPLVEPGVSDKRELLAVRKGHSDHVFARRDILPRREQASQPYGVTDG